MFVLKFGGSSVADIESIERVCHIIKDKHSAGDQLCLVFSAFGKTTDRILEMGQLAESGSEEFKILLEASRTYHFSIFEHFLSTAKKHQEMYNHLKDNFEVLGELLHSVFLSRELSARFKDLITSYGERNSNYLLAKILNSKGVPTEYLDARKIIKTNNRFGGARVLSELTEKSIRQYFSTHKTCQVVTGFISSTVDEITTTLGRGGSDYTASILGSALSCKRIEIWTDVNGVMTANPNLVKDATSIKQLSYLEAMELSHFGAKVIFPPTIVPAQKSLTTIVIKNSRNVSHQGTHIENSSDGNLRQADIAGITSIPGLCIFTIAGELGHRIHGLAARLFGSFSKEDLDVYLITQGSRESCISFAVSAEALTTLKELLEKEFSEEIFREMSLKLIIEEHMCAIAIVGEKILFNPGITGRAFSALGEKGINIKATAQGSSERNISFLVKEEDEKIAVNSLHFEFFNQTNNGN